MFLYAVERRDAGRRKSDALPTQTKGFFGDRGPKFFLYPIARVAGRAHFDEGWMVVYLGSRRQFDLVGLFFDFFLLRVYLNNLILRKV